MFASGHISTDNGNNSFSLLQVLNRLKACRRVCVSAIEMRQSRRGSALIILVVSTRVNGRWLSYGCRNLSMGHYGDGDTIVPKVCNLTNHEKSEKPQWWAFFQTYQLQYKAKQDLIQIPKKISNESLVIKMFLCDKGNNNTTNKVWPFFWPRNNRFGVFLAFLALIGFLFNIRLATLIICFVQKFKGLCFNVSCHVFRNRQRVM